MAVAPEDAATLLAEGGELLFCGSTDWQYIGRKGSEPAGKEKEQRAVQYPALPGPHRVSTLQGIVISSVAAGCASCHCLAITKDGQCYAWGRNESGQLGLGDLSDRGTPTRVEGALAKQVVVKAAAGRKHSSIITEDGSSFSWGLNQHGQLGTGSLKAAMEKSPAKVVNLTAGAATFVACGAEFTVWLQNVDGASILTAGLPQYGQLGHGTDHEYNAKDSSVKLMYEAQPTPRAISTLAKSKVNRVACGTNHTVAADTNGAVYTWGFGGHGRLGHKEQKDEWRPRQVDAFSRANVVPPNGLVAAGAAFSAATAGGGQLYMWGKVKSTGDNWMYPKPHMDLSGWNIRALACGNTTSAAAADSSCISWGTALYGELGFGPDGPKSSAAPKKIDALEGTLVTSVACGLGFTVFVVSRKQNPQTVDKLPLYEPSADVVREDDGEEGTAEEGEYDEEAAGSKRKKAAGRGRGQAAGGAKKGRGAGGGKGAAKKAQVEDDDDDDDEPPAKGRGAGKARGGGRGRGRGAKKK
eukprot:TRINITY_DN32856_c0_g1_i2.p1 TRINITY_DN32856_c0_g1~~TRINITY_DN32856_c0_g1_i2.p1  ORF type:complete len:525 (+),score=120.90 TRINITY_DN32856_c0_g1_i2:199-1773(+)